MKNKKSENSEHRAGFVAIVGPANAGKSTLLNAILGSKVSIVSAKQQSTRNRVRGIYSRDDAQVVFVDTPGFLARRYRGELSHFINRVINQSLTESDRTLLVLDAKMLIAQRGSVQQIAASLKARELTSNFSVVLNKVDQVDSSKLLPLIATLQEEIGTTASGQIEFFPVSALKGQGVDRLLDSIIADMPISPPFFDSSSVSDQPEEFLISEIIREKLFGRLHKEIPYSLAVVVESLSETESLTKISARILVERESQKGMVIGKKGDVLKQVGTASRLQLEKIFGTKVHLELHVKVEADWTKSQKGMRRAGYGDASYGSA